MKVTIGGREFDLTDAIHKPRIGDVLDLKKSGGAAPARIVDAIDALGEALKAVPKDASMKVLDRVVLGYFDDVDHLEAFAGIVFLCLRKAGEPVSWDDALNTPISDVRFLVDEGEADDPKDQSTPDLDEQVDEG